ncbi:hypothetical protein GV368_00350 [Tepidiphilus sp. B18-69]|uniref:Uncharacterized protein n=2 Tax=Tepidiphilus baoligensis TaxID=2698687 RepID=A0ABX1QIF5_9PROT|nr:hypothetical protein [Tepidiphilus baoligensis]NMH15584.1 hypothetical protein [Tepidiphilus baoligensis]
MGADMRWVAAVLIGWSLSVTAWAGASEGGDPFAACTDAGGRIVAVREDPSARKIFETRVVDGEPVIVHNPKRLPELWPKARLFFFAHECARIQAGFLPPTPRTLTQDRLIDCDALEWLARGGWVQGDDVPLIEQAIGALSRAQWRQVPGEPRRVELAACYQRFIESMAEEAEGKRRDWSRCVEVCGEQMVGCRAAGGRVGEISVDCMRVYLICVDICNRRYR